MPSILLVDDSVAFLSESTAAYVMEALDRVGYEYDTFNVFESATSPSIALLSSYDIVIYSVGANSTGLFAGEAANRLMAYLDAGGALLLSGGEYAYQNTESFLLDYMHVAYDYYTRPLLVVGTPHDPIGSGMFFSTESPFGNRDYFMLVRPLDEYPQIFITMSSESLVSGAAVRLPADGTTLDYRAVFLSFALEAIVNIEGEPSARDELLRRTVHWLLDTTPPSVVRASPIPGEQAAHTNTTISIELSDDGTGVDPGTIELLVDDGVVEFEVLEFMDSVIVLHPPGEHLAPGSEVSVEVRCADSFPTPNEMAPYRYTFTVRPDASPDTEPPFVDDFGPAGVVEDPDDPFSVFALIADTGTGVDTSSLVMTVNGRDVNASVTPADGGYVIAYMGRGEFGFDRSYEIEVAGQDLATPPNVMASHSFSFSIGADVWPPILVSTSPPDGAVVDLDEFFKETSSGVSVVLRDFGGKIDADSIRMTINDAVVNPTLFRIFNGAKVNYYGSRSRFDHGQQVRVEFSASDDSPSENVMAPVSWTFRFADDGIPPGVQTTIPNHRDRNVPRNTHVFVIVSDDVAPESVSSDTLLVESDPGGVWQGRLLYDPNASCIHFAPYEYFPSGATVSVTVSDSIVDGAGNVMEEPYQFDFRASGQYDFDPPDATSFREGSVGDGTIRCRWRLSNDSDAIFKLYYDSDGCCEPYEGKDADQGPSPIRLFQQITLDLTGLDNQRNYHFAVTAMDACANESDYCMEEYVASPEELLDASTLGTVVAGAGSALLQWSRPQNLFVGGYNVHYREIGGGSSEGQADAGFRALDVGLTTDYTLRGLTDGVRYELFVTAYDEWGQDGHPSNIMTVRPRSDVDWFQIEPSGPIPPPRFNHQVVLDAARKRVYVLGGTADHEEEDILYVLDLERLRWERVPTSGPFPTYGRCLAHFDAARDCIWMLTFDLNVYQLSLPDHVWIKYEPDGEGPVFEPSEGTTLIGSGFLDAKRDRLLYYGAFLMSSRGDFATDFYAFDLQTHEWSTFECSGFCPSNIYLTAMAYAADIDRAFLFGGLGEDGVTSSISMLDPESLLWLSMPLNGIAPTETYIHDMQYDSDFNRMIAFGGRTGFFSVSNSIFSYDISGNSWTDLAPILTGIPRPPVVRTPILIIPAGVVGSYGYMMIVSGYDYQEMFDDVYCLRLYDFTADTIPPAKVDDLGAELVGEYDSHARLTWTAPGDDGDYGRAKGYDLRFSTMPISDDADFGAALTVPILAFPSFPGATEDILFALPETGRRYYFALKAFDEELNYSEISNCASAGHNPQPPWPNHLKRGVIGPNLRDSDDVRTTTENDSILK